MNESQLWGGAGVLLALLGTVVIVLDSEFSEALGHGGLGEPIVLYGIGVAAGNEMFTDYRMITAGAGLYSVDVLAERVGVKGEISNLAGGS